MWSTKNDTSSVYNRMFPNSKGIGGNTSKKDTRTYLELQYRDEETERYYVYFVNNSSKKNLEIIEELLSAMDNYGLTEDGIFLKCANSVTMEYATSFKKNHENVLPYGKVCILGDALKGHLSKVFAAEDYGDEIIEIFSSGKFEMEL